MSLTDGLVAHWKFDNSRVDEVSSFTFEDSAGALTFSDSALPYSGPGTTHNVVITAGDTSATTVNVVGLSGAFSYAFWFKGSTTGEVLVTHGGSSSLLIRTNSTGKIRCDCGVNFSSATTVTDGAWHHCIVTFDGTNSSGLNWYVDGAADATGTGSTAINTPNLTLALNALTGFVGEVDDLRIYSRELSTEEVAELYAYVGDDSASSTNRNLLLMGVG